MSRPNERLERRAHQRNPRRSRVQKPGFIELAAQLAEIGKDFYRRGWALGTSGNFSAVVSWQPLRLAITPTDLDKSTLAPPNFLEIDGAARVVRGGGKPSSECGIHLAIIRMCGVGAVLHTHSVWSTILSEADAPHGGITIQGYEMLKGLRGVRTHEHSEWLPILENSQDMLAMAQTVEATLKQHPAAHGFLLRRHGLYTWGNDLAEAKRHTEILEFLLEVAARTRSVGS